MAYSIRESLKSFTTIAGVVVMTALAQSATAKDFQKTQLTHSSGAPENHALTPPTKYFNDRIAEESEGNIKIRMFWGGTLGDLNESLDLVAKGAVDISDIIPGYFTSQLPLASMAGSLPHVFFEPIEAMYAFMELSETSPLLIAELERNNIKPLIFRSFGNFQFLCTKPLTAVADFEGLKIRSFGSYIPKMLESLGATPVNVPSTDVYEALKRGSMDCAYGSPGDLESFKLFEVGRYLIDIPMGGIVAYADTMNLNKFNSLPAETQELLVKVGREATDWWADQSEADHQRAIDVMLEKGVEMVAFAETDQLRAAVPDMLELWKTSMKDRGLAKEASSYSAAFMELYETRTTD